MAAFADIRAAFALLTVAPGADTAGAPDRRVAPWFPWVGLALGGVALAVVESANAASVAWGDGGFLGRAAWPLAVVVIGLWAALTRLLHWDGLADVADGWWGGSTTERRLEIMADSSVGAFGVATLALTVLAQVSAVAVLLGQAGFGIAVFAVPVFGRCAAMFGAWLGSPARPGGLGARVAGPPSLAGIAIGAAGLALAAAFMFGEHGVPGFVWCVFAFVVSAAVPHLIAMRTGGITGDVLGASVVVTETIVLVAAACVVAW